MTSLKDALNKAQVNKNTVGLKLVDLDMSLLPPGFIRRAFPVQAPAHKLHNFGDPTLCIHENYQQNTVEGLPSGKVRCGRNVAEGRQSGYLCPEHQKLADAKKTLGKDSIYRFNSFDSAQLELPDYILGVEEREIADALANGRVWAVVSSKSNGDLILIEPKV